MGIEKQFCPGEVLFNVTGGTKAMSIAAWSVAASWGSKCMYLQMESGKSRVYEYEFANGAAKLLDASPKELPDLLTLDDCLRLHIGDYAMSSPKCDFERAIAECLKGCLDECFTSVSSSDGGAEMDLVFRLGNQIGVGEAKTGKKAEGSIGINQLMSAASQRRVGIHAKKFLFVNRPLSKNSESRATELDIKVILLKSWSPEAQPCELSCKDKEKLEKEVLGGLTGGSHDTD